MKKLLSVLCMLTLCFALASCAEEEKKEAPEEMVNPINVTISFTDSEADEVEAEDFENIGETEFAVEEGSSVLEATQIYCVANGQDVKLNSAGEYIVEMLGLAEGDFADTTGWIYTVNGESVMVSAGEQILKEGDKIAWEFVDFSTYTW